MSITALINSKNGPASNYENYGFYKFENKTPVTVIIFGEMVPLGDFNGVTGTVILVPMADPLEQTGPKRDVNTV